MKRILILVLSFCMFNVLCGCDNDKEEINIESVVAVGYSEGKFTLSDGEYTTEDKKKLESNTVELIEKAKKVIEAAKCENADFSEVDIVSEEDAFNNRRLYKVSVNCGEKRAEVAFREDSGSFVKFSSGLIVSDSENYTYTEDKVDELLEVAQKYYNALDVPQNYELSGWQMDFGGTDWQVEFSRSIEVEEYKTTVYNYGEMVRMRISGADGKLLSVNVFDTPLNTEGDKQAVSYEDALKISELPKDTLEKSYIGCYTLRDKGYARLCWCFEADLNHSDVCSTKWVYVDLYTGEIVGEENCH